MKLKNRYKNVKDFDKEDLQNQEQQQKFPNLGDLLNGNFLNKAVITRYIFFIIYLFFLGTFYIGNRYSIERKLSEIDNLKRELTKLRYMAITTSAELMKLSRQSSLSDRIQKEGIPLSASKEPPFKIFEEQK